MKNPVPLFKITLIIVLSCFLQFAKAQIVYTDINPDTLIGNFNYFHIDINADGINDYELHTSTVTAFYVRTATVTMYGLNDNTIAVGDSAAVHPGYPLALSEGATIPSAGIFTFTNGGKLRGYTLGGIFGYWENNVDKFLGIKLIVDGSIYYGWIELSVYANWPDAHATVISYAYNSTPNQTILAGQTCPPLAQVVADGPTTFCDGGSVILSSVNSGNTLSYQWKKNNVNIPGATSKNYTATTPGSYKVTVTDFLNGCSKSSAKKKVNVPCKINGSDLPVNDEITVAPNPFSYSTTISFSPSFLSTNGAEKVSVRIFDMTGRIVKTLADGEMHEEIQQLVWDATDEKGNPVNSGIYILKFDSESCSVTRKLSVIK